MTVVYLFVIFLILIPVVLVVWCAATEARLMKNRPQLSWLLPAGAVLASVLSGRGLDGSSGMGAVLWSLPALLGRCGMSGSSGGAAIGAGMRWFGLPAKGQDEGEST